MESAWQPGDVARLDSRGDRPDPDQDRHSAAASPQRAGTGRGRKARVGMAAFPWPNRDARRRPRTRRRSILAARVAPTGRSDDPASSREADGDCPVADLRHSETQMVPHHRSMPFRSWENLLGQFQSQDNPVVGVNPDSVERPFQLRWQGGGNATSNDRNPQCAQHIQREVHSEIDPGPRD